MSLRKLIFHAVVANLPRLGQLLRDAKPIVIVNSGIV